MIDMTAIIMSSSSVLLAIFFFSVFKEKRQTYLGVWAFAWLLVAFHYLMPVLHISAVPVLAAPIWVKALSDWILVIASLNFLASARLYSGDRPWTQRLALLGTAAAVWAVGYGRGWLTMPLSVAAGTILFVTGFLFWRLGRKIESRSDRLLAISLAAWAALVLLAIVAPKFPSLAHRNVAALAIVPQFFAAVLMVMGLHEEQRRRVERNMLALSNLNLATSTFSGGEIQKMLSQALDRVLNVARIPLGALCLNYGDVDGPTSIVVTGFDDSFTSALQGERLDHFLVNMVSRLGGLMVLHDLDRNGNWAALEREPAFQKLRQQLLAQSLSTVVGISLQAKERVLGVLLLGTPDRRTFNSSELRLLLALGHQIGMAVENSYLIQQTARRSEELHILNEIGRALSSTLQPDILFERIYSEIRRLLDVSSFFIAFYDGKSDEVRFEIEVLEGERQPKRTRPPGNHLVEFVVRERQPLLIRDHFHQETTRLGFEPVRDAGSICVVPLILYDRAIGVMAVHSPSERAFDEGHVELLRVLSSEACIAIENSRLFAEEQKKSRHLTLVNNISSHAITTLNPEEMLAKIASEIETGLTYDHIGIAVLDYSAKELVIQAEAGVRHDAIGRRILLGEGLIGQVARSGQLAIVREVNASTPRLIVPGSVSAIALPVAYADSLLGVLYVESAEKCNFP